MDSYHPSYPPRVDTYRPKDYSRIPPPPPVRDLPPRPPGSPSPMYQFRNGQSYRPGLDDHYHPASGDQRNDFSFRADREGPRFPQPAQSAPTQPKAHRKPFRRDMQAKTGSGPRRFGTSANNRPFLRSVRETTPEQLMGMVDGQSRFKAVGDLSDSEAEMELESDAGDPHAAAALDGGENNPHPDKKARTTLQDTANGHVAPKWSNPDPYTVLPPPDETQAKKKDVVKLIRKAKVLAEKDATTANPVTDNADFISLNFGDEPANGGLAASSCEEDDFVDALHREFAPTFSHLAPTFSHLRSLRLKQSETDLQDNKADISSSSLNTSPRNGNTFDRSTIAELPEQSLSANITSRTVGPVKLDVWPPPDTQSAISSKRRLGDDRPPQPQKSNKRKRGALTGDVLDEWLPWNRDRATPWCTVDHSSTEKMGFWLHKEICDFYAFVKPQAFEEIVRRDLVSRISAALRRIHPNGEVHCFGSFAAGLYLPTADMDLVFVSNEHRSYGNNVFGRSFSWMNKLAIKLEQAGIIQADSKEVIAKAKVPIIKFTDQITGIRVDISFENMTGIVANGTFQNWKAQYPAMPVIVTLIKQFLLMRGLNEVFVGGIGGFTVTCLVVSLLQHMPSVQSGNMKPEHNLGEILLNFFDLYGNKFNIVTTGISMNPPGYFPKNAWSEPNRLSITDPNKPTNDISSGSHKVDIVLRSFADAYKTLQRQMALLHGRSHSDRQGASILGAVLGGDYSTFEQQRNRLRQMYDSQYLSAGPRPY